MVTGRKHDPVRLLGWRYGLRAPSESLTGMDIDREGLFPLDGARWLRGDVIDHAVDAGHLIDNATRHLF